MRLRTVVHLSIRPLPRSAKEFKARTFYLIVISLMIFKDYRNHPGHPDIGWSNIIIGCDDVCGKKKKNIIFYYIGFLSLTEKTMTFWNNSGCGLSGLGSLAFFVIFSNTNNFTQCPIMAAWFIDFIPFLSVADFWYDMI